ncbi:DUF2304 domain-containing protein [Holdemanella biformis]|jgi:hypothetical protein|uniref:DUF2304 domain-containing protein n=1 Tax=Holdemanella biformis TaxID=1735 RepID=UPI002942EA0A|nr:DUF2304 domain-containing protein [Holdemanella biformis]
MSIELQLFFIIASVITFLFVIKKIQKNGYDIADAVIWILWAVLLLVISIFPQIPTWFSKKLGFMSSANFIFCMFIFFLYIMLFNQNAQISKLRETQKELIQKLSIREYKSRKEE